MPLSLSLHQQSARRIGYCEGSCPVQLPRFGQSPSFHGVPLSVVDVLELRSHSAPWEPLTESRRRFFLEQLGPFLQADDVPVYKAPEGHKPWDSYAKVVTVDDANLPSSIVRVESLPPLEKPTLEDIQRIRPRKPLRFHIPVLPSTPLRVNKSEIAAMDLMADSQARQLVQGGNIPSIIGENWNVRWSKEKLTRDMLQNFYDGHQGTLEGVDIQVSRQEGEKGFKVKIVGLGEYDYEKAYLLGGTSKSADSTQVGHFGEGLKVIALHLLREYGADAVDIASNNWKMTYTLPQQQQGEPTLFRQLHLVKRPIQGNYLEFTTTSPELVAQLFKAIDYFYHPYNPDFKGLLFKNEFGGVVVYPDPKQRGNVYIGKQRYAVNNENNWDGTLKGMSLWTNTKTVDKGRDRTALYSNEVIQQLGYVVNHFTDEELIHSLKQLRPHWDTLGYVSGWSQNDEEMVGHFLNQIVETMTNYRRMTTTFDSDLLAYPDEYSKFQLTPQLKALGYTFVPQKFRLVGVPAAEAWYRNFNQFEMLTPTVYEKQRILILKKLVHELVDALPPADQSFLSEKEREKPIYLFEDHGQLGPDPLAQGKARYEGIWLGRSTLKHSLSGVFNTYLYELMNYFRPDGSRESSTNGYSQFLPILFRVQGNSSVFQHGFLDAEQMWNASLAAEAQSQHMENVLSDPVQGASQPFIVPLGLDQIHAPMSRLYRSMLRLLGEEGERP